MPTGSSLVRVDPDRAVYLKAAFLRRPNLAAVGAGLLAAVLLPFHLPLLVLVGAVEAAYLHRTTAQRTFRDAVDRERRRRPALSEMLARLPMPTQQRFETVRQRCLDMARITSEIRGSTTGGNLTDDLRTPALERMLWMYLRLLITQEAIQTFLKTTTREELSERHAQLTQKRRAAEQDNDPRILRALDDNLADVARRIENYKNKKRDAKFLDVEVERIEDKIRALAEMAVTRQDAAFLSDQVDAAARDLTNTESALQEIQEIAGVDEFLSDAPALLTNGR